MPFEFETTLAKGGHGMHFIRVPMLIGEGAKTEFGSHRVICRLSMGYEFHCAVVFRKESGYFIMFGKGHLKKTGLEVGDEIGVELLRDESEFQMEMPEEWMGVIETDYEAKTIFDSLTAGKKRSILHLVGSAKQVDTRINRALKIAENLKRGVTSPREFLK